MDFDDIDEMRKKYEELNNKKSMFKLKRYEKNLLKKYNKYFSNEGFIKQIEEERNIYNEKIAKENIEYLNEKERLRKEKEECIKKIENETNSIIQENKKKYEKLFNYLNEIKNDKVKLIEYFKNPTIF
jgi:hypothetical protein